MAGSSIAGMIVGTVFIVIFASATVTMVDNINKAQQATEVNLPDPEINLITAAWTSPDGGTLILEISNVGSETISINYIYFSLDGGTPISIGDPSLTLDSTGSLFPGETILVTQTGVTDAPTDALLVAFEYSSSVTVTQ
tara:strand:- start:710 stop:1126 length:417 start_codon:yes stop_codon:yes gene_type:complete